MLMQIWDISYVNNGNMYLFKSIGYTLSGQQIKYIHDPGKATSILGLLNIPTTLANCHIKFYDWRRTLVLHLYMVTSSQSLRQNECSHSPLKLIFGFAEDYDKTVYGFKLELKYSGETIMQKQCSEQYQIPKKNTQSTILVSFHVVSSSENKMKL